MSPPSSWITRWAPLIPAGGRVLDLACGSGRHLRWLAAQGFQATGVDRDAAALASMDSGQGQAELIQADLEHGPWPLSGRQFDAVVVTHYLWRPTWPLLLELLAPGGVLLYETFAEGNQTVGKPSRPDFLLQPGELLQRCAGLRVLGYEDGFLDAPPRFVQRIAARRPAPGDTPDLRLPLPAISGGPGPAG
ncbi:MAG: class I SAM-dependent methyltransferase [Burkholderiaceae bacterium]|nr:class I SAM-dependent methyltransferase [Burkholderiaceae bacterium]